MEEVLETYQQPLDERFPVVCIDEARRQLVSETRIGFADKQGVQHVDYEYKRAGVAEVYMVCQPLAGWREVVVTDNHSSIEWAKVLGLVAETWFAQAELITVVADNLSAHSRAALYEVFGAERARAILRKLRFIHTPKHGSWLNIAEIELSVLTRQGLTDRVADGTTFEQQVQGWVKQRNDKTSVVNWQFTAADARIKLKRLYPSELAG